MPIRPSKDVKGIYLELLPDTIDRAKQLAEKNSRSFREEVQHALERHLDAPPTIKVIVEAIVPPLKPAEIDPPKPKRKKPS